MKRKVLAAMLAATMVMGLAACGSGSGDTASNASGGDTQASADASDAGTASADSYKIGILQLVQHPALDAATQGFKDALIAEFGEDALDFDEQNAQNDSNTCATVATGFVADSKDLILANATPALQACSQATGDIPVLGTSVTEYGVALGIDDFEGTVGSNVSGTSDLAPLTEQAAMIKEIFPDAETIGLLYCSAEANSEYQVNTVQGELEALGYTCKQYSFTDSNDMAGVTTQCADEVDVIYVPTDNTVANNTEAIYNITSAAKVPVVAGEEGICQGCGVVTLSISYYDLGYATGEMAVKILKGEANVSEMPIEYAPNVTKKYNAAICEELGVTIPEGYEAIEE